MKLAKAIKPQKFLKSPMGNTRGEMLVTGAVTGVAVGTTNSAINQHYVSKGKNAYNTRRLYGKHGTALKGGGK